MSTKKGGYIDKFLKKADSALQNGVKSADKILEDAVEMGSMTARQASKASKEIHSRAKKEGTELQKRGIQKINAGVSRVSDAGSDPANDLDMLERLAGLRDAGILTDDEFNEKKKKILYRI